MSYLENAKQKFEQAYSVNSLESARAMMNEANTMALIAIAEQLNELNQKLDTLDNNLWKFSLDIRHLIRSVKK